MEKLEKLITALSVTSLLLLAAFPFFQKMFLVVLAVIFGFTSFGLMMYIDYKTNDYDDWWEGYDNDEESKRITGCGKKRKEGNEEE